MLAQKAMHQLLENLQGHVFLAYTILALKMVHSSSPALVSLQGPVVYPKSSSVQVIAVALAELP